MKSLNVEEQIEYALDEVSTYPRGYVFFVEDILNVKRCIGATNYITFKSRLKMALSKTCSLIGTDKYRKK